MSHALNEFLKFFSLHRLAARKPASSDARGIAASSFFEFSSIGLSLIKKRGVLVRNAGRDLSFTQCGDIEIPRRASTKYKPDLTVAQNLVKESEALHKLEGENIKS